MKLLNRWRNFIEHFKPHIRAMRVDELPDTPQQRLVYLIGDEGEPPWQAAMICPCGCGSTIHLSLIPQDKPRWQAATDNQGFASLWPSVARYRGCAAHFILRSGRIRWV